jgi:hypothetical protein
MQQLQPETTAIGASPCEDHWAALDISQLDWVDSVRDQQLRRQQDLKQHALPTQVPTRNFA